MLQRITLQCSCEEAARPNYNWGSLFHGFLMDTMPSEVGEMLHQSNLRPFSQYVVPQSEQQLNWVIGLWDSTIADYIIQTVMPLTRIDIKHKGITLKINSIQRSSESEAEFFSRFFTGETLCRRYEVEFVTPCTHKQDGAYVLFPTPELMIHSVSKRYAAFGQEVSLDDPEAIAQVARHIRIVRYSLRSAVFHMENTKITGYMGKTTLVINGPEQLARLAGAMLSFAEYSGMGIKTALGMGGVRVREVPVKS